LGIVGTRLNDAVKEPKPVTDEAVSSAYHLPVDLALFQAVKIADAY
jgi:hypothetical protein